tara:strand:+ start:192 stop:584 length:393 start_codon:yes stop_codon:yes gene_type:complete
MTDFQFIFIFFKFSVSGLCGVFINFLLTFLLKEKLFLNKYISNSSALTIALFINFILNRNWTYQVNLEPVFSQFLKFLLVVTVSVLINHVIVYVSHKNFKFNFYFSKLIAVALVFIWNFVMHSIYTFKSI